MQECLLVLQSTERMEEGTLKEQFAKWCMEEIKLDQEKEKQEHQISKDRFAISNIQIEEAKKVLSDSSSTDAKKDNARKMLTEAQKQLEELVKGKK